MHVSLKNVVFGVLSTVFIWSMLFSVHTSIVRATTQTIYSPETITNINERIYVDVPDPVHQTFIRLGGMSASATSQTITGWNLGKYTGAKTSGTIANYQRGVNNNVPGSSAVQLFGNTAGFIVDTTSIPGNSAYTFGLANAQWGYAWNSADAIKPWATSTSKFNMDFDMKIPIAKHKSNSEPGYVYASILVRDGTSGKYLYIQPQILDTRYIPYEFYGFDVGTQTAFVGVKFVSNGRYASKTSTSTASTKTAWNAWKHFGFTINRTQLNNAITDINAVYGAGLSLDYANYTLILITIQDEVYWGSGVRGTKIAASVRNINAWSSY